MYLISFALTEIDTNGQKKKKKKYKDLNSCSHKHAVTNDAYSFLAAISQMPLLPVITNRLPLFALVLMALARREGIVPHAVYT